MAVLGRGGQGEVLRALDHQHGRWVALKVRPAPDAGHRHFLLSEARILLSLRPHPNLPLVREDFFWEDRYVLVMDWVEGTDLGQLLSDTGDPGLPVTSVLGWLHQAASALGHLHNQGVVHGDVKPANLVLTPDGSLVLVDFGISTTTAPGDALPSPRLGSPGYAAPELAAGEHLTPASDVYSLAATAVALLSGAPPTRGPPDWEGVPNSAAIERALRRGLAIDAQRRPASPLAFVERLQAHVSLDLPTGVVTFLLSDIEGSTARWEHDADRMADLLARHDTAIADAVEVNGGRLLKTRGEGDATFSVFARASDALGAALAAQRELRASTDLDVRMALHSGEAQVRDGDYFGGAVNRAARLRALAHGGQVLLSSAAADLVVDALPPGVRLDDLGQRVLRDLNRPERVFTVETGTLAESTTARATPATETELVAPVVDPAVTEATPFVGRDEELETLRDCLAHALIGEPNVVLVSGAPGIGKSRLVDELRRIAAAAGASVVGADAPDGEYGWWLPIVAALEPEFDLDALAARPAEPEVAQARLLDDVVGIVEAGAESCPLVLVLEDLHGADAGSLRVLRHLARALDDHLADRSILVVGTYRDTAVDDDTVLAEVLTALRDSARTASVSMAGLTTTDISSRG